MKRVLTATVLSPVLVGLALLMPAAAPAAAQAPHNLLPDDTPRPPPFYAVKDARVVTVSGATLERATVVVENGLIVRVAPDAEIPAEAWVLEGEGLTVYPGLFDALSDLGLRGGSDREGSGRGGAGAAGPGGPGGGSPPAARGPFDRPGITSWRAAADELDDGDRRVRSWREGGFTTALTAPDRGMVTGQGAVVSLVGTAGEMVVRTPAALRINLDPVGGFRSFPGSLMGVIANLRQLFLDAGHGALVSAAYEAGAAGRERLGHDRNLAPVRRAVEEGWPVLLPGNRPHEMLRAVELGREFGVRPVIYGGHGAYGVADELARAGVPVLVRLGWPERGSDVDPEADEPLTALELRARAPESPAALHRAGVPFAFYADGVGSPREALAAVRTAVEAGLPEEAAVRALTLGPATIFGVDDRLGSVEAGKIASLLVVEGDLLAEDAKVHAVFVDGRLFQPREDRRPTDAPEVDLTGSWTLTIRSPQGTEEATAELRMASDGTITGTVRSPRGEGTVSDGWVSGSEFRFTTGLVIEGQSLEAVYRGTVEGNAMDGTVSVGPFTIPFTGVRPDGAHAADGARVVDGRAAAGAREVPAAGADTLAYAPTARNGASGGSPRPASSGPSGALAKGESPGFPTTWRPLDWSADPEPLAIRGATVLTAAGRTIEDGTVLVRDGKIAAVGPSVEVRIPDGVRVIDAAGRYVTPGIVDAHAHIAVDGGIGGVNEGSIAVSSLVRIEDVIDPTDIEIYRSAAGGVTTSHVMHGSANPIGGQNAILKHRWGAGARGLLLEGAPPTIKFALGENPKRSNFPAMPGQDRRYPATRMGVMDVIRQAFLDAEAYRAEHRAHEEARGRRGADRNAVPPRRDLTLEPLVEILEGRRHVHAHSYRGDEILALIRLAEEFGFRIAAFQHVLEGYRVADEIAAHGAGASTFSDWWAFKVEAYEAIPHNAAIMTRRGVLASLNSDSPQEARHLNQEAAKSMKWGGLSEEEALALVTINPARQLRIDDRAGSIEEGKDADLVIWENHPLSSYARTLTTLVDGRVVFDVEEDRARREWIAAEKERLKEMIEAREKKPEAEENGETEEETGDETGEPTAREALR